MLYDVSKSILNERSVNTVGFETLKTKFDIRLNEQQEKAVCRTDGPSLLLAVPGSGKTTVIVARVGYMLYCAGIDPKSILTLTFSKAAASEMRERFCRKFGKDAASSLKVDSDLRFSTIHSFCLSVIKRSASVYGLHIPSLEPDNVKIIRKVFFNRFYESPSDIAVKELSRYIGYCKNQMYTDDQIETIGTPAFDFGRFYNEYEAYKRENDMMDFDDQLLFAHRLLEDHPDMLEAVQARYKYINVDEAQDTSLIQHKLIRMIAGKNNNLFMVGDEDQSIYGFRAAYPEALLRFKKDYPGAEILLMETNYRCASNIVGAADSFIRQNRNRYDKTMKAVREKGRITETRLKDAALQYRYLLNTLKKAHMQDRQVAVLYRNNESAVPLVDLLDREGIPFCGDVSMSFFEHALVKDMTCALRLARDPCDFDAYKAIYYKLGLYTDKARFKNLCSVIKRMDDECVTGDRNIFRMLAALADNSEDRQRVLEFSVSFARIARMSPIEALKEIDALFYRAWIRHLESDGRDSAHSMDQKLSTLYALTAEQSTIDGFLDRISGLRGLNMQDRINSSGLITLSTIHSSKGMEFDKVILIDVIHGILPSEKGTGMLGAAGVGHYEEEVRLFYVAITRAKNEIEVITAPKRFGKPIEQSQFVLSLLGKDSKRNKESSQRSAGEKKISYGEDKNLSDSGYDEDTYKPGARLIHKYFGAGTIKNRTGDILTIRFDDGGEKRMLLSGCIKWGYISVIDPKSEA